jgi:hypothetical protein
VGGKASIGPRDRPLTLSHPALLRGSRAGKPGAGTRWIFALQRLREPGARDYTISICGDFWLEVRGDEVVGRVTVAEHGRIKESVPLADMLAWIRSGGATPIVPLPLR